MINEPVTGHGDDEGAATGSAAPPRSPARVMTILEALAKDSYGLPLARLCERVELPKSTLLSLLRALEEEQYVSNHHGLYQLGEAALRLSSMISAAFPFPTAVHVHLVALSESTNESVLLGVLSSDNLQAVYVDKVEAARSLRYTAAIGERRPLYCTAIGRALLAFQQPDFLPRYLSQQKLVSLGPHTKVDARALERELAAARAKGVASAFEEHTEGVGAFAAPVFGSQGLVRAAVSLAAPVDRARTRQAEFEQAVRQAAAAMSRALGAPQQQQP